MAVPDCVGCAGTAFGVGFEVGDDGDGGVMDPAEVYTDDVLDSADRLQRSRVAYASADVFEGGEAFVAGGPLVFEQPVVAEGGEPLALFVQQCRVSPWGWPGTLWSRQRGERLACSRIR